MTVEKDKELKEIGELDDKIFKLCKEKMRTEKKSLQMLHQPDQESSEQAQMQATKKCLLKIGDHIEKTITAEYKHDHNQADTWRRCVYENIFHYIFSHLTCCLLYTSPSPRDKRQSRMPSSA